MTAAVKQTEQLLLTMSKHLSSRECCRGKVYKMVIGHDYSLLFEPNIYVFPDRYHRREEDKQRILEHLVMLHFPDLVDECRNGSVRLKQGSVVPGHYEYQPDLRRGNRYWRRIGN